MKQDLERLIFQYVLNRLIPGQIRFFQSWNSIRKDHKRALNSFSLLKRGHLPAMFQTLGLAEQKSETKIWVKSARAGFHPTRFLTHGCLAEFLASSQLFIKAGGQISCRGDTKISLLKISDFIIWRIRILMVSFSKPVNLFCLETFQFSKGGWPKDRLSSEIIYCGLLFFFEFSFDGYMARKIQISKESHPKNSC